MIIRATMPSIPFTGNYEDLSTDRGYQFKFYCEKCNNGYMSTFRTSKIGVLGTAANLAGGLFGGVFGRVADSAYEVQRAVGGPAHDSALKDAVSEIAPMKRGSVARAKAFSASICSTGSSISIGRAASMPSFSASAK